MLFAILVHLALGAYAASIGVSMFTIGYLIWGEKR